MDRIPELEASHGDTFVKRALAVCGLPGAPTGRADEVQ
jgi:hypothetical protein